jgi:hypothetical protein
MKKIIICLFAIGTFLCASEEAFVTMKKIETCPESICLTFDNEGQELFIVAYDDFANEFWSMKQSNGSLEGTKFYITYQKDEYENTLESYDMLMD